MTKLDLIETLKERRLFEEATSQELALFLSQKRKVYCGFDPTADSLHLGNFVAIMVLHWFQRFGHQPVIVLGGATAQIGDPSGKSQERPVLSREVIDANGLEIRKNFSLLLQNHPEPLFFNNLDWYAPLSALDLLSKIGRDFRMGPMLAKKNVRTRLESEEGLSFTEFSYQLLQGYDFYHLFQHEGVTLEIGGGDQWGNIMAGVELVRKKSSLPVHGLTYPLITKKDGRKFGKSEEGAIWLSATKLSPYAFYQTFFALSDEEALSLLRPLTLLPIERIEELEKKALERRLSPNELQVLLGSEITRLVHGEAALLEAQAVTEALKPGSFPPLDQRLFAPLIKEGHGSTLVKGDLLSKPLLDILANQGLIESKSEGRRLIANRGLYLNHKVVDEAKSHILAEDLVEGRFLLLSLGKKKRYVLEAVE